MGLGCGNPQAIARLKAGETVVDLGSGAGIDCFLAARQVGAGNVEFRLGEIEHLPIADNTADAIISNCVVNLVPDKAQVFREAFRVLKSGGRLAIADVVNARALPEALASDPALLCGCVSGAVPVGQIEAWLEEAGFVDVCVTAQPRSRDLIASWAPGTGVEDYVVSATIEARKA